MSEIDSDLKNRIHLSVVTVVYNGAPFLEETILSVTEQTYDNIKYFIVDGGSSDGTLDIIRKYEDSLDSWISEADRGIYDAMNKAIQGATPGYLCFMNAGDVFYNASTVADVVAALNDREPQVIYGDSQVRYADGFLRMDRALAIDQLRKGMCFSHQATFVEAELLKQNLFNIDNKIGADYELFCHLHSMKAEFTRVDVCIATTSADGVSDEQRTSSIKSHWLVARKYWPGLKTDSYYLAKIFDSFIRMSLRRLLPRRWVSTLVRLKYQ